MNAPLIIWLTFFSFALPVVAAGWRCEALDRPMKLVAAWYAVLVIECALAIAWTHFVDRTSNLVLVQVFLPVEATLVLSALADWQLLPLIRSAVRVCVPLYWVAWAFAFFLLEGIGKPSTVAGPLLGLLVLAAALTGFISHLQRDTEPVHDSAWGWMLPGLAIFFGINVTTTILVAIALEARNYGLMAQALVLRTCIYLLATFMITWGFLWPTRHRSSGPSSSRLRWR